MSAVAVRDAIVTAVTGLASTGANVFKGDPHANEALPHLRVDIGSGASERLSAGGDLLTTRQYFITAVVSDTSDLDGAIYTVVNEVTAALGANHTFGLSYVKESFIEEDSEPERDKKAQQRIASIRLSLMVLYTHAQTTR